MKLDLEALKLELAIRGAQGLVAKTVVALIERICELEQTLIAGAEMIEGWAIPGGNEDWQHAQAMRIVVAKGVTV